MCMATEKNIVLSAIMYSNDYDERFPLSNWIDSLTKYVTASWHSMNPAELFKDPAEPDELYGYAVNKESAGCDTTKAQSLDTMAAFFDSPLNRRNAISSDKLLPNPPRHRGYNNMAFMDGHVRRLTANVKVTER